MAEVLAFIKTVICAFLTDEGSIRREEPVGITERLGARTSLVDAQQKESSEPVSEKKDAQVSKCPGPETVKILDSKRKHFHESVDLSKRKTFVPVTEIKASNKDVSAPKEDGGGGAQGIIIFALWYIFIAYSYARGTLPAQMPPEPAPPPGKGPPPPPPPRQQQPDNLSTAGPTEVNPPSK